MHKTLLILILSAFAAQPTLAAFGSSAKYRPKTSLKCDEICSESAGLDLTDAIKKYGVEKARKLSQVNDLGNITSYSGFFTTSNEPVGNKNSMFYWYFPAQNGA